MLIFAARTLHTAFPVPGDFSDVRHSVVVGLRITHALRVRHAKPLSPLLVYQLPVLLMRGLFDLLILIHRVWTIAGHRGREWYPGFNLTLMAQLSTVAHPQLGAATDRPLPDTRDKSLPG
jgi:hypothetical protein